jgi:hypothetical protein
LHEIFAPVKFSSSALDFLAGFIQGNVKHQTIFMDELVDKLKTEAGLTDEQAKKAIETIKNFVIEKFPMLEGAVGNLFGNS